MIYHSTALYDHYIINFPGSVLRCLDVHRISHTAAQTSDRNVSRASNLCSVTHALSLDLSHLYGCSVNAHMHIKAKEVKPIITAVLNALNYCKVSV